MLANLLEDTGFLSFSAQCSAVFDTLKIYADYCVLILMNQLPNVLLIDIWKPCSSSFLTFIPT